MFLLSLYLLDIVNTSITSHASKMLDMGGICSILRKTIEGYLGPVPSLTLNINFNETLV